MTRQKSFKREVRSRMQKTGERYAAARGQLIARADRLAASSRRPAAAVEPPVSDEALLRASGRGWQDWFGILDASGASARTHAEIARWLREEHSVDGWWAQSITVGYERARGMRGKHEMGSGYSVAVNRTIDADSSHVLAAFTDSDVRQRWLPGAVLQPRPTRAARTLRFDWSDDGSRLVVSVAEKGSRSVATVQHERLPDAASAERMKSFWRERADSLKRLLESGS